MRHGKAKLQIMAAQEQFYEDMRNHFRLLGDSCLYGEDQKKYAFENIREYGLRATARILHMPRRTLQRWCRKYHVLVARCPYWVYEWAERRRKRREFWAFRGYF